MKSHRRPDESQSVNQVFFATARSALVLLLITVAFMACGDAPKTVRPLFYRPSSFWIVGLVIIVGIPALAIGIIYLIGVLARESEQDKEPERTIEEIIKGDKPVMKLDWQPLPPPQKPAPKNSKLAMTSALFCLAGIICFVVFAIMFRHLDQAKPECSNGVCVQSPMQFASRFFFSLFFLFEVLACLLGSIGIFKIHSSPDRLKGLTIAAMSVLVSLVLMVFWKYFGFF